MTLYFHWSSNMCVSSLDTFRIVDKYGAWLVGRKVVQVRKDYRLMAHVGRKLYKPNSVEPEGDYHFPKLDGNNLCAAGYGKGSIMPIGSTITTTIRYKGAWKGWIHKQTWTTVRVLLHSDDVLNSHARRMMIINGISLKEAIIRYSKYRIKTLNKHKRK